MKIILIIEKIVINIIETINTLRFLKIKKIDKLITKLKNAIENVFDITILLFSMTLVIKDYICVFK
jgi:hypothetical protein